MPEPYSVRNARRFAAVLVVTLAAAPCVVRAQTPTPPTIMVGTDSVPAAVQANHLPLAFNARNGASCLREIPPTMLVRSALALAADLTGVNDSAATTILPQVDFLVSAVADRVGRGLPRPRAGLPAGEPAITWRSAGASVLLVVGKRGTRLVIEPSGFQDDLARTVAEAARAELTGDNPVFFPDGAPGDSTVVRIHTAFPTITEAHTALVLPVRKAFAFAAVLFPVERGVTQVKEADLAYPQAGPLAEGFLLARFVVDTAGHASAASLTDEWPMGTPRLRGEAGTAYRRFLTKIGEGLPSGRYTPAQIGGCVVSAPVVQRHEFGVKRR